MIARSSNCIIEDQSPRRFGALALG
jgi:hypothetical protein